MGLCRFQEMIYSTTQGLLKPIYFMEGKSYVVKVNNQT